MLWIVLGGILFLVVMVGQAVISTAADGNVLAAIIAVPAAFISGFAFLIAGFCLLANLGIPNPDNLQFAGNCAIVGVVAGIIAFVGGLLHRKVNNIG